MLLITGGAGYIGSHAAVNFLNAGFELVIFDNLENGHIETIEALKKIGKVHFVKGDLRNIEDIDSVFKTYNIDTVIHFAAFALVEESVKEPSKYYRNNVFGTLNLLDTMVKHNVKKIVFSSTCAIFGNPTRIPVDEDLPKAPLNAYGRSKFMVEGILEDYDRAYGLKSIKLRYFNVAGADEKIRIGEWHEPETHLVPNILKSIFEEDKIFKIFGTDYDTVDGTCVRDYVNVEDLAEAHRLAYLYLQKNNKSDMFNLGTEQGSSVKEVFNAAEKVVGKKINVKEEGRRAGDAAKLYANSTKAKTILNWHPQRTLEDSIKTAYLWEQKRH